jgi:hypothetical protein
LSSISSSFMGGRIIGMPGLVSPGVRQPFDSWAPIIATSVLTSNPKETDHASRHLPQESLAALAATGSLPLAARPPPT